MSHVILVHVLLQPVRSVLLNATNGAVSASGKVPPIAAEDKSRSYTILNLNGRKSHHFGKEIEWFVFLTAKVLRPFRSSSLFFLDTVYNFFYLSV